MKIKFLQDYTGRETGMLERKEGEVLDLSVSFALELISLGIAEEVSSSIDIEPEMKPRKRKIKEDADE